SEVSVNAITNFNDGILIVKNDGSYATVSGEKLTAQHSPEIAFEQLAGVKGVSNIFYNADTLFVAQEDGIALFGKDLKPKSLKTAAHTEPKTSSGGAVAVAVSADETSVIKDKNRVTSFS